VKETLWILGSGVPALVGADATIATPKAPKAVSNCLIMDSSSALQTRICAGIEFIAALFEDSMNFGTENSEFGGKTEIRQFKL
jgi:hypothetical protein